MEFHRLAPEHMRGILEVQLQRIQERLEARGLHLEVDESASSWLAQRGYDPDFGARPLKRLLQRAVVDPISHKLLEEGAVSGTRVRCTAAQDGLEVRLILPS